jgi:hypothetical protein
MGPIGRRLQAEPVDGDELAVDTEQPLDHPLRLLVRAFADVLVTDDAVHVGEVESRPVVVVERVPDRVVVVQRDKRGGRGFALSPPAGPG